MLRDHCNSAIRRVPDWLLYVVGIIPIFWLYYQGATGGLGVEPVKVIEHQLGLWALWLLIAGLAISPLARHTGVKAIKLRRAIGLLAFAYVLVHMLTWLILDVQILSEVWKDILKRPYITIGMLAFVLMIPLAITSNNWSIRMLTPLGWQRLHKLAYIVALLGALHFVMLAKGFQLEPLIYFGIVVVLVAERLLPKKRKPRTRSV